MGCEAAPEGGPAARIAASYLGSGYRVLRDSKDVSVLTTIAGKPAPTIDRIAHINIF